MDKITGYFFAPSHGYNRALWAIQGNDDGMGMVWSTGPHVEEDLAKLIAAGIPHLSAHDRD